MCGIYGTTLHYNLSEIEDKLKRASFRGPDKMGFKSFTSPQSKNVILGHNRLSIIDLDPRSNQPLTFNKRTHIVFNGEIFNFKILKKELQLKGHIFSTASDTEVICAAYLEYGEDCVNHFNGMFAFVIYDENKNQLFGARDRLGQKPFYYYQENHDFEFSSQLSSIQLHNSNLTISKESISSYLTWGNIPDPNSIFNEIKKLKAGHTLVFDLSTRTIKINQYWDIDYQSKNIYKGSFSEAKVDLNILLKDAVKTRLFADVPVGVFLSGGVDSSLISAIASQTTSSKIKTFSVKFNEKGFDESKFAEQVANHLNTDHHTIACNYKEGIDLIENFCYFFDEPFADSSAIPSMLLSKHTKSRVTVALSGDAGDENFIGYKRYEWMKTANLAMKIPVNLRKFSAKALNLYPNYKTQRISSWLMSDDINDLYINSITGSSLTHRYKNIEELKYLIHTDKNIFERISDFDIKTYLNWDINTKVDRASMAYSLEVRAPLQDYRIVEFARSLPTSYKYDFKNNVTKYILKELLFDYVPKDIFNRPKSGFTMPFSEWFRNELKEYVLTELNDEGLDLIPLINKTAAKRIIAEHMSRKSNRYSTIWSLLVLKQWLVKNGKGYSIR